MEAELLRRLIDGLILCGMFVVIPFVWVITAKIMSHEPIVVIKYTKEKPPKPH